MEKQFKINFFDKNYNKNFIFIYITLNDGANLDSDWFKFVSNALIKLNVPNIQKRVCYK